MNILLIDTGKVKRYNNYVPLALLKLSTKHKKAGDSVELIGAGQRPKRKPDIIYFSLIFLFEAKKDIGYILAYQKRFKSANIIIGGVSVTARPDIYKKTLEDVEFRLGMYPELDQIKPDYEIANIDYAYGFTSRGCPRKCEWCFVPIIEGKHFKIPGWEIAINAEHKRFVAFDNNILACGANHLNSVLDYCEKRKILIDFNQGMDAEILMKNKRLQEVFKKHSKRFSHLKFAWDSDRCNIAVPWAIDFLYDNKIKPRSGSTLFYVLFDGFDEPEKIYERIKALFSNKKKAKYLDIEIKLMRFKDMETGNYPNYWGTIATFFHRLSVFMVTGILTTGKAMDYFLKDDYDNFITKCSKLNGFLKAYQAENNWGNKLEKFVKYCESK